MADEAHWNRVYDTKESNSVSWYAPSLSPSLELMEESGVGAGHAVIDVGGGASTLPGELLDRGLSEITVLDISSSALAKAREQLGARATKIRWVAGNVTEVELPEAAYDLWHDRAVFHFLTDEEDQDAYVRQVSRALKPGGSVILATFGPQGPEKCSGLPVARYDDEAMVRRLGEAFERVRCLEDTHVTPWGAAQQFTYCLCRRRAQAPAAAGVQQLP